MMPDPVSPGQLIGGRYRLERILADAPELIGPVAPTQGTLWLARDQLASEAPCALRQIGPQADQERSRDIWGRLQGVLHPQVPRLGPCLREGDDLWLVREWQAGRSYGQMLAARCERQLVFGAGEVLLLLRQLLPVLAALHSQDLLHGDLSPENLLRRDSDGLPVLLDFGLVRGTAAAADPAAPLGGTAGYAPPELLRGEPAEPWMDLHALGVVALVLLSGDQPGALLDPASLEWRWPSCLDEQPALRAQLQRLLERESDRRFSSAGQALLAFQGLEVPESTGPVPRADRTVMLVPPPVAEEAPAGAGQGEAETPAASGSSADAPPAAPGEEPAEGPGPGDGQQQSDSQLEETPPSPLLPVVAASAAQQDRQPGHGPLPLPPPAPPSAAVLARRRDQMREEAVEGGLWPVLVVLVLSAVVGTAIGWWWLGRGRVASPPSEFSSEQTATLPPGEVEQRQQLLDRLRALQVDRGWFLRLVDASLLAQYPERRGRLPGDSLEDAPLRRVWSDLAEDWLARVEQLPMPVRQRLGSFRQGDWQRRQEGLVRQGIAPPVLRHLVSASARTLLGGRSGDDMPEEPFRQLWFAAAEQVLANLRIEPIEAPSVTTQVLSAEVPPGGARLFPIRLPADHGLALGVNGSPLLQMSVYGPDGRQLEATGPLRVVSLKAPQSSPLQLLVSNEGVAAAPIRLSLRADPPLPASGAPAPAGPPGSAPSLPAPAPSPEPASGEGAPAGPGSAADSPAPQGQEGAGASGRP